MNNLFKNKTKVLYFAMGILFFAILIASLAYMTNYAYIHVYYTLDNGNVSINSTTLYPATEVTNQALFDYFATNHKDIVFDEFKYVIFDFQVAMSELNSFFVTTAIVGLVCFGVLLMCSNHNRRVYYKSNLIVGILAPLTAAVFTVISLIRNLGMMGVFNENFVLFNEVSLIQNPVNQANVIVTEYTTAEQVKAFVTGSQPCNSVTYILFTILFVVVIIYLLVLVFYAIKKYNADTKERNEIIERAVKNNG